MSNDDQNEWKKILDSLNLCKKNEVKYKSILDQHEEISYEDVLKLKSPYKHAAHGLSNFN